MGQTGVFYVSRPVSEDRRAAAVLVAAGSFSRMGGIPKQLIPLNGQPVIAHTIRAFQMAEQIREIVLVARPEDVSQFTELCKKYCFDKVSNIIIGGASRQESVFGGVQIVGEGTAFFAIHDGARPLISSDTIDMVVLYAHKFGAAAAAVPVKDTIKISDDEGFVLETPERSRMWNVQTPQVFESKLYMRAIDEANVKGHDFTDDCQLIEMLGHKIYLAGSDYGNIKITTPEDIALAQGILDFRSGIHERET